MKSVSELTDFYYETLFPTLSKLEDERKKLRYRIIIIAIIYTLIALFILFSLILPHITLDGIIFFIFGYLALGAFLYKFLAKDYTKKFKQSIMKPLISAIDKNLEYSPNLHISEMHFNRSKLFTSTPDRVSGNDYVRGKIDGIQIEFSDLHAEKKHKNSKGGNSWSTLFKGLFIVSEFHKNFKATTVILPDTAQSSFGDFIGSFLQSNNFSRQELIKMDDPAFEKEFVVYGSNQIEARYILTHTLMQKLLNYKRKTKEDIYVSFNANKIHLAIAYNKDLFEPSIFHSLLKYTIAMEYIKTLHLAIGIVEELQLNQKLWSKL